MMKPLGLPFKTPLGYYYYETQKNEILAVDKELYDYLYDTIINSKKVTDISEACNKNILELRQCGYLLPSQIKHIEHPQTGMIENMLDRRLIMITLQLTQMCNLRCKYCIYSEDSSFNRSHADNKMSFETAKKIIDFYHKHTIDSEEIAISFYGGEPLLEFPLIQKIVGYANRVFEGKRILYRITTNATLFTDQMIEFFFNSGNDFLILISLDGTKEIQNKNRRFPNGEGTYDIVVKNIQKIYDKNPLYVKKMHFNAVVDPQNDYLEIVKILDEPLFQNMNFQFNVVEYDGIPATYGADYLTNYNYDMFLGFIAYFREHKKGFPNLMIENNFSYIDDNVKRFRPLNLGEITAPGGPCEPGRMRLFANYKGEFFPCERVSESSECMKIGSVDTGFDIKNIKDILNVATITKEECKNCWAFNLCNVCIKGADDNGVVTKEKKLKSCVAAKRIALDKINQKVLVHEDYVHKNHMDRMRR